MYRVAKISSIGGEPATNHVNINVDGCELRCPDCGFTIFSVCEHPELGADFVRTSRHFETDVECQSCAAAFRIHARRIV